MDKGTDTTMDAGTDTDGRWMTYGELAAARRIDRHSAVKLVARHRWRRQKDNQGVLRVLVPPEWASKDTGTDSAPDMGADTGTDMSHAISALEAAFEVAIAAKDSEIATLRDAVSQADARAAHAEQWADTAAARADEMRIERDQVAARADQVAARADRADAARQHAQDAADALRWADEARRARGRLRRVLAAWRGE